MIAERGSNFEWDGGGPKIGFVDMSVADEMEVDYQRRDANRREQRNTSTDRAPERHVPCERHFLSRQNLVSDCGDTRNE